MPPNFLSKVILRRLPQLAGICWGLLWDRRVSLRLKMIPLGAVIYLLLPYDVIPDFMVPLIGEIDDILVLFLAFRLFLHLVPAEILYEHQRRVGW